MSCGGFGVLSRLTILKKVSDHIAGGLLTQIRSPEANNNADRHPESGCPVISLLAVLEEENRMLRSAVIDLLLETLLLREAARQS